MAEIGEAVEAVLQSRPTLSSRCRSKKLMKRPMPRPRLRASISIRKSKRHTRIACVPPALRFQRTAPFRAQGSECSSRRHRRSLSLTMLRQKEVFALLDGAPGYLRYRITAFSLPPGSGR